MARVKKKNRFVAVDVWRSEFGEPSVKAIFELYRVHTNCTQEELKQTSLREAVDYLRKLEKPDYESKNI